MKFNDNLNLFSVLPDVESVTAEGCQFIIAGISSLSDILGKPVPQLFQTAIEEHYRSCRLDYSACKQLVNLLDNAGIKVNLTAETEPEVSMLPSSFSKLPGEHEEIANSFYRLLDELGRIPAVEEIAEEAEVSADRVRCSGIRVLMLEHQQILNYIQWFLRTQSFELSVAPTNLTEEENNISKQVDWKSYPYNLLADIVPEVAQIKDLVEKQPEFLAKLAQRLDCLVYFDLLPEERNIVSVCYKNSNPVIHKFNNDALEWGMNFLCRHKKLAVVYKLKTRLQGKLHLAKRNVLSTDAMLKITVEELGLSVRSCNCLKRADIHTVGDIISITENELMRVRNLGRRNLEEVIDKVYELGLCSCDEKLIAAEVTPDQ